MKNSCTILFMFFTVLISVVSAREVRVYNWTDYIDPSLIDEFTQTTNIKVVYDTFDSNEVLLAKTLTGNSGYDIVVPSEYTVKYLSQAGRLLKIDREKLPNYKNIWEFVNKRLEELSPINEYSVPYMWGTTGIAYNVEKIKELVPDAPLDSMELLMNPIYAEKLAKCGIYMIDTPNEVYPMVLMYLGFPSESTKNEDLEKATEALSAIRPYVKKFHSSEYINAMANGDACLTLGWSGDLYLAKARAQESNLDIEIKYIIPKEGALLWFDQFSILKDAKNVDEAYEFIDYLLDAKVNARAADYVEYSTSNSAAFDYVRRDLIEDPNLYPSESELMNLQVKYPYSQKDQKKVMKLWINLKSGN